MIFGPGREPTLDLSPAEFLSLGIRSQSRILDWRGEKVIGPLQNSGFGHTVYQLYRFLIERVDYPDGRIKEIRLLDDLRDIGRYLKNISLSLEDNKLLISDGPEEPPPDGAPPVNGPPGGPPPDIPPDSSGSDPPGPIYHDRPGNGISPPEPPG